MVCEGKMKNKVKSEHKKDIDNKHLYAQFVLGKWTQATTPTVHNLASHSYLRSSEYTSVSV